MVLSYETGLRAIWRKESIKRNLSTTVDINRGFNALEARAEAKVL